MLVKRWAQWEAPGSLGACSRRVAPGWIGNNSWSWVQPLSLCSLARQVSFLGIRPALVIRDHSPLPPPRPGQVSEAAHSWTGTPKAVSSGDLFSLQSRAPQVFCYSDTEPTNTSVEKPGHRGEWQVALRVNQCPVDLCWWQWELPRGTEAAVLAQWFPEKDSLVVRGFESLCEVGGAGERSEQVQCPWEP